MREFYSSCMCLGGLLSAMIVAQTSAFAEEVTEPLRLPILIVQSNPVTAIRVGNRSAQAIVDTGGGGIALSEDVIRGVGGIEVGGARERISPHTEDHRVRQFKIPVVEMGGRVFHDVLVEQAPELPAGDAPSTPNRIGREFINRYLAIIDYAGFSITLWPAGSEKIARSACGDTVIPMERTKKSGLVVSEFTTAAGALRLLWSTGVGWSALTEELAKKQRLATLMRGRTSFYRAASFSAAGQEFGPVEFAVLPLDLPKDFDGLIGGNFFSDHVVCLDYERRQIRVR